MDNSELLNKIYNEKKIINYLNENKNNINTLSFEKLNKLPQDLISLFLSFYEFNSSDFRSKYYFNMLVKLVDKTTDFLRSYIVIFNELEKDEIVLLKELKGKELNIVDTMDLDKANNKFVNLVIIESDLNEIAFEFTENERLYIDHLISRNLIEWPVYKQDPLIENGVQKGIKRYSKICLTSFGTKFSKYIFD
jgi:hypothetical protein